MSCARALARHCEWTRIEEIAASYPSSDNTWTVTGFGLASFFDVDAQVYCLQAQISPGISIVQAAGSDATKAVCSRKTVLLSRGFFSASGHDATESKVYALCAASHVLPGKLTTAVFNPHSSTNGENPGGGTATCPAGQIATGGEYDGGDTVLGSYTANTSFAGWSVNAGGDADMTITALCVTFQE